MGYTPPYLEVRKITGGWNVLAPSATNTDDLYLYPNTTSTYPYLLLEGNSGATIKSATGTGLILNEAGSNMITIYHNADDVVFLGSGTGLTNHNIFLSPNGSGLVKFGAYTATPATDSTGYITILDAGGNTRKLMVQA